MCRKNLIVIIICITISLVFGFCFAQLLISFFEVIDKTLQTFILISSILIVFLFSIPFLDRFTE